VLSNIINICPFSQTLSFDAGGFSFGERKKMLLSIFAHRSIS